MFATFREQGGAPTRLRVSAETTFCYRLRAALRTRASACLGDSVRRELMESLCSMDVSPLIVRSGSMPPRSRDDHICARGVSTDREPIDFMQSLMRPPCGRCVFALDSQDNVIIGTEHDFVAGGLTVRAV